MTVTSPVSSSTDPMWHGVPCIDDEVHHHLLDLPGSALMRPQHRIQVEYKLNVFAEDTFHQLDDVADTIIEIQGLASDDLMAGECQQLPGQSGRLVPAS